MSLGCHSTVSAAGRDDSGNSSSSSSSSISVSSVMVETAPGDDSSSVWLPDYSLYECGYELADCSADDSSHDVLLPLHRTVCCALCRSLTRTCPCSPCSCSVIYTFLATSWWRGRVVERRYLTGELSLSCARPAADG